MADRQSSHTGIRIRHLYKIFGSGAAHFLDVVRGGMSKAELNERFGLVMGLNDVNLDIPAGKIQVIMGLSGSGKSTLIRHINRLVEPTAGQILIGGRDIVQLDTKQLRELRRNTISMVFQKFALLPHRTVLDNTLYGLEIQGFDKAEQRRRALDWISKVGLAGYEKYYPNQLSGGMQQRVGLARALANGPSIILMDEAFSALDPLIRTEMQSVLLNLQRDLRKTIVFITHDLDEALKLGDQIAILRDGSLIQQGTSQDIVLRPADDYIAAFVKEVNRGRIVRVEAVMKPLCFNTPQPSCLAATGTTLEEAATLLLQQGCNELGIIDSAGKPVGRLGLEQIMAEMVGGAATSRTGRRSTSGPRKPLEVA